MGLAGSHLTGLFLRETEHRQTAVGAGLSAVLTDFGDFSMKGKTQSCRFWMM